MKESGRLPDAVRYLQEALYSVNGTPLFDGLKNQLATLKAEMKSVQDEVKDTQSDLDGSKQAKIDGIVAKETAKLNKQKEISEKELRKKLIEMEQNPNRNDKIKIVGDYWPEMNTVLRLQNEQKANEEAILKVQQQESEEARRHIKEISTLANKLIEMRKVLSLYKGKDGDIMELEYK